ncbi:MAG: PAS domain S-box protein [Burkholderiaceae bacterium]
MPDPTVFGSVTASLEGKRDGAVRTSSQMLATVVDCIPALICVIGGRDLRIELVNRAYQALAPTKEMVGRTLNEVWPETGRDFLEICRRVLDTGEPYEAVDDPNQIRRSADGPLETAYFSWSLHRIELPGGEGSGLLNTGWETTQRKSSEEAARATKLRYRYLVEQVPDGIFVADPQGRYIDVNPRGCRLLGMTRDEVLSSSISDVIAPDERRRIPDEVARLDDGAVTRSEWVFRRKDGSSFIGEVTARRNSEGNLQAVLRDITETKKIEDALRESEQRFRSLADDLPLLIWVHDAQHGVSHVNRTYCEYFGITFGQAMGDQWKDLTHPDDCDAYSREFVACLTERRPFHGRVRVRRADGEWRWMESWARPRFRGDEFLGMVGTSADITNRIQAEEALRDADRRKDEFLALLAHELRNPLAPLRTAIELLRLGKQDERLAEQARAIMQRQVEHMVRLIDDLLDVSRIARGKLELRREVVNLSDVLRGALESCMPAIQAGRHRLDERLPSGDVAVEADPVRLTQVFANLLNNAARYTPPGGRIALRADSRAGEAVIVVEDDGVGIPKEMLERVFEPFVQVESRDRQTHGGLGLGLSLARSLVELHAGSIKAESAGEGRGSRITVRLPVMHRSKEDAPLRPADTAALPTKRRVLIVDDNRDAADTLAALLDVMGQDVRVAYDGRTALKDAEEFKPTLVLLDIGMPTMDGYEVAAGLRALQLDSRPVLVALTGFGQASDRQRSAQAGFDLHVVKPISPETLAQVLATTQ